MFRKLASFLLLFCSLMVVSPALATDVYVAATAGTCAVDGETFNLIMDAVRKAKAEKK
jgi:hypothetical protein